MLLSALMLQSCATLFTGTRDKIKFESDPPGAAVQLNGIDVGTTPCEVAVRRKLKAPMATIKKEGYELRTFELTNKLNGVSIINLFNLLGWGIDCASGAVKKYDQKAYSIKLDKK